ncbi:MAG: tyrosine-type recombinase/integrase [Chloroflexi bacterium]|nr:tyrosine-type recombinase/integrase [Chloroflexota bacterium]
MMAYTGLRTCEVRRLKWADVDIEQRSLWIGPSKSSEEHVLPLTQPVLNVLGMMGRSSEFVFSRHHLPLSRRYCQSRLATIGKTCEVKATPHQLRHSAATMLLNAGLSVWAVKEILGHKSVETTLEYARTYDSTVAKEYQMAISQSGVRSASYTEKSFSMV